MWSTIAKMMNDMPLAEVSHGHGSVDAHGVRHDGADRGQLVAQLQESDSQHPRSLTRLNKVAVCSLRQASDTLRTH